MTDFYDGANVSTLFNKRWRSGAHIGEAAPWCQVRVRRGRMARRWHTDWPNPQFGKVVGDSIHHQWYADWTPLDDWTVLDSVGEIDLDQSFDKNGITVASITADNVLFQPHTSLGGNLYHTIERGYLYPWRGWAPRRRPGSGDRRNDWWRRLPNAQIEVQQGYGSDTAVKTFTGLIDSLNFQGTPDQVQISARDFGGVLADSYLFGWNKTRNIKDPITFVPEGYSRSQINTTGKRYRWIEIKDVTDIVRCCLRWAGFKEWQIQDAGVNLRTTYTVDRSKSYMDVITDIQGQLGWVFFISEPTSDDLSIGVPIFRQAQAGLQRSKAQPISIGGSRMLTDLKPVHDNTNDRYIIRVRGELLSAKKGGVPLGGDTSRRVTFQYWPPWMNWMAGIIKQLTYYNIGDQSAIGYQTIWDCQTACILIAIQIALARDTATASTLGNPAIGLDSFAYLTDAATGIAGRCYIANRKSTMKIGGDGTSQITSQATQAQEPIWSTDFGGSLVDSPEWDHLRNDYQLAIEKKRVISWGTPN